MSVLPRALIIRFGPPISVGFINAQSNLRILSDGVVHTNDTLYAPFGSSLVLTCEGGVGEERWYTVGFGGSKMYVGTDSLATVYQSSGQLYVGDFRSSEAESIFCEDEALSTVFTSLMEGVLIAWHWYLSKFCLDKSFLNFQVLSSHRPLHRPQASQSFGSLILQA